MLKLRLMVLSLFDRYLLFLLVFGSGGIGGHLFSVSIVNFSFVFFFFYVHLPEIVLVDCLNLRSFLWVVAE